MIITLRCFATIAIFSLAPLTFAHKLAPSLFEMTESSVETVYAMSPPEGLKRYTFH